MVPTEFNTPYTPVRGSDSPLGSEHSQPHAFNHALAQNALTMYPITSPIGVNREKLDHVSWETGDFQNVRDGLSLEPRGGGVTESTFDTRFRQVKANYETQGTKTDSGKNITPINDNWSPHMLGLTCTACSAEELSEPRPVRRKILIKVKSHDRSKGDYPGYSYTKL